MKRYMTNDRMVAVVLIGFSIAMLAWIIPLGVEQAGGDPGPGMDPAVMPRAIVLLLGLLALLLAAGRRPESQSAVQLFPVRTLVTIAFFVAYMVLTPLVGYLPASLVILPAYLWFFGARNWKVVLPLSIALPVALYLFFGKVMLVMLPAGIFME